MATLSQMRQGLTLRPTFNKVLNSYVSGESNIEKPDRTAIFIRESYQYQDLPKNWFHGFTKQQNDILKTQKRDILLK